MVLTGKELGHGAFNDPDKTTCRRCLRDYNEPWSSTTPIDELGQIMLRSVSNYYTDELCPDCTEQLGMFTLLWFK
jgi:hypothetical protein